MENIDLSKYGFEPDKHNPIEKYINNIDRKIYWYKNIKISYFEYNHRIYFEGFFKRNDSEEFYNLNLLKIGHRITLILNKYNDVESYNLTECSLYEYIKELDKCSKLIKKYNDILMSFTDITVYKFKGKYLIETSYSYKNIYNEEKFTTDILTTTANLIKELKKNHNVIIKELVTKDECI